MLKMEKWPERWPLGALVLVAALSVGLFQWNYMRWQAMLQMQVTALDNMTQARLNVNRSYLIIVQLNSPESTHLPQDALAYLDRAILSVDDWLQGRSTLTRQSGLALDDPLLRPLLLQYRAAMVQFRDLEAQSILLSQPPHSASAVDRRIAFSALVNRANDIEFVMYQRLESMIRGQQLSQAIMLVSWCTFLLMLGLFVFQVTRARQRALAALQESEERLRAQYMGIPLPTYTWQCVGDDFVLRTYNDAAVQITEGSIDRFVGARASDVYADRPEILEDFRTCAASRSAIQRDLRYHFKIIDRLCDLSVHYVFVPPDLIMIHTEDRTERNQLEAQLLQSQKMESIGRLAGGIAHDFNNLLTAIGGYADMAIESVDEDDPICNDLQGIQQATERAARLTSQLLAFARKQPLQPRSLNLNELIASMQSLIRRVLPEYIQLDVRPCPQLGTVLADPGQIEQVLLNLVVNARDAMAAGGRLLIETSMIQLDEVYTHQHVDIQPGMYVLLSVSDTGVGMSAEVQQRAFEPFFTTKGPHKGSGLGLAMCYGIVQQHGGNITIYSEPGHGTTIKVYLPHAERASEQIIELGSDLIVRGSELVLVTEDDEQVRHVITRMLCQLGYMVLETSNGIDALQLLEQYAPGCIQLLITDVVMPNMSGQELASRIHEFDPAMRVLLISGYAEQILLADQFVRNGVDLLTKPFSQIMLAQKVRALLDRPQALEVAAQPAWMSPAE